ncbi:SMI1/KNR4 family protein [Streptomyces sp. NPDC018031]|uniref:SMI1/KNR4 family protein n=1 Tax=Streptomyces sp. NPDC018031 TaxID=3365033 RepID=UPI00378DB8B3
MTAVKKIVELLGEPRFHWSDPAPWLDLEAELGMRFPQDYRTFVDAYGPIVVNNQLWFAHPAAEPANLRRAILGDLDAWADAPEEFAPPHPVGSAPGELLPWGSSSSGETVFFRIPAAGHQDWRIGVVEHDEGGYVEHDMTFSAWLLAYLEGRDVTVCARNFAPDGPFYRPIG